MNIEEDVIETLNKTIKFYEDLDILYNSKEPCPEIRAVRWIITAYEKEKEASRKWDKEAQGYLEELAGDGSMNIRRIQELEAELEKQSKEIEELNKSDASKEQSSMNYYNLYKELVDKIKAKIEEVKDGTYDAKIVLQSLLEKE